MHQSVYFVTKRRKKEYSEIEIENNITDIVAHGPPNFCIRGPHKTSKAQLAGQNSVEKIRFLIL